MAIPGYTPNDADEYATQYINSMITSSQKTLEQAFVEYFQMPLATIQEVLPAFQERCNQVNMRNFLDSEGLVDWTALRPVVGNTFNIFDNIKMYGEFSLYKFAIGFVDGYLTIFFGEYADLYILQASRPSPTELMVPKLYISSADGFRYWDMSTPNTPPSIPLQTLSFLATFMTIYGETRESNIVTIDRVQIWNSVTLEIDPDQIPSYAGSVRYYRLFDDTFRLVSEVKIT